MSSAEKIMRGGLAAQTARAIVGDASATSLPAGATQGTATLVTANIILCLTTAAGAGYLLPSNPTAGDTYMIANGDAVNALKVYPAGTDKINNLAASTAVSISVSKGGTFRCVAPNNWVAVFS